MVEKMKLVHVQGTLPHLDEFLGACCLDGRFDLEPASQYMSASLGYAPLNEEDPYTPLVERIEAMAGEIGAALPDTPPRKLEAGDRDQQFLDALNNKFSDLRSERDSLQDQQRLCEDAIAQYSHFLSLKANVDEITDCAHVKARFGFLPQAGYNKLMSSYADDPYILFVPCSQTKEGYWGIYLTLFSLFMWKVKHNALFHLMIPCGIASTCAGFVYGSFFGYENLLDPLYHALGMASKPVAVMDSITGILLFAVYIGVVLVLAAMGMNIYTQWRRGLLGSVLFGTNSITGVLTYLAGVNLVSAFMGAWQFMPVAPSAVILVLGLLSLLFAEVLAPLVNGEPDWKPADGWGNYMMQNVFELLESVLSYLSNTISFLRVGAFVIVHASMMMVVFTLAGEPANLAVVVIGNLVVIALEALLSAIQGIRLEFYEMFSRFYTGGGRRFEALDLKRRKLPG